MLPILDDNVTTLTITPFIQLELLPDGAQDWGLTTNNNLIRLENKIEEQQAIFEALDISVADSIAAIELDVNTVSTELDAEAVIRAQADQDLQDQIDSISIVGASIFRQSGTALAANTPQAVAHGLGHMPLVDIVRESDGVVVTHHYDTVISHSDNNTIQVTVGTAGNYTVMAAG